MPIAVEQLGEGEVEPCRRPGAGAHRDAETRAAGQGAVDGDDEGIRAPDAITRVAVGAAQEYAILDGDGREFAGPHANKGELLAFHRCRLDAHLFAAAAHGPQRLAWRMEKALPGLRADRVAEQRVVVPSLQLIAPGLLAVGPAGRQIGKTAHVVVDDGAVPEPRPQYAMTTPSKLDE